ncbi:MAG TPA: RNA methyltransferase [Candidatus Paceibacterota bacterium]|jgi:tRNA G18 (ribose-2'-O)-methylase SpoU|nr:RNA methyltransferase [Candidatus Paceibacterota bacterium]
MADYKIRLCVILSNLRSALNVGSIFRTADALKVEKIYLCGTTPKPTQSGRAGKDLAKTALNAENYVSWKYYKRTSDAVLDLKKQGFKIIALEKDRNSISVFKFKPSKKTALVLGNEKTGISKNILEKCDKIIEIPMFGKKESLNVSVAFGVSGYLIKFKM